MRIDVAVIKLSLVEITVDKLASMEINANEYRADKIDNLQIDNL